ncbi:MAG: XdhC family protein [Myxococcales bacterium]|nr:XdhC family protein [Myxococcales bacterium]
MKFSTLQALNRARKQRKPVALLTFLDSQEQRLVDEDAVLSEQLKRVVTEVLRSDRPQHLPEGTRDGSGALFVQPYLPPLRLLITGGVHVAQHLVPIARRMEYDVVVVDPREDFASAARFEDAVLCVASPEEAFGRLSPDRRTAVVTLTHLPDVDDLALAAALRSEAFYIGALGSSRTHALRCERLAKQGFDAQALSRIHGPVGLDIGARTPPEIAVSIAAELTLALRGSKRSAGA